MVVKPLESTVAYYKAAIHLVFFFSNVFTVSFVIIGSQLTGVLRSMMELICVRSPDTVTALAAVCGSCNGT